MARTAAWLGAIAIAATLAGCRARHQRTGNHGAEQVLYDATVGDPKTFNPLLVTDASSSAAIGNLFEALVKINPVTTLPEPNLAESWELSDGGKLITFHLRHGVRWFDGEPFTARDVLFTMRAIYDPRVPNSTRPILTLDGKQIETRALDDYTVQMKLPHQFASLLYSIGFEILPAHVLEKTLNDGSFNHVWGIDTPPGQIIGLGAYRMVRYVQAQFIELQRNPNYWMRDPQGGALPRLHGQTTLIVQDQSTVYLRFATGQTDVHSPRPEEVLDLRGKASQLNISLTDLGTDTGSLFFAFNRNPRHYVHGKETDPRLGWFSDLNFMRALAHAIDKQGMINLCFHGMGSPAVADISPQNKLFHNPNLKDYDYDLKLAAQLLEAAGYHMIKPGLRADPAGHPLIFNLTTNAGASAREQMCAILKQDLASLGIQVNYRSLEFTTLVEKLDSTYDWDCVLIGFTGTIDPANAANVYRSSGNLHLWNPAQTAPNTPWEAEIDRLLELGSAEMDVTKRASYYWRIQELLHDQLPILETVRQERFSAYRNQLENYRPTVWGLYQPELIQFRQN